MQQPATLHETITRALAALVHDDHADLMTVRIGRLGHRGVSPSWTGSIAALAGHLAAALQEPPGSDREPAGDPDRACEHRNFAVHADVNRLTRTDDDPAVIAYMADLRVNCADCGEPFRWTGLQAGLSQARPMCNLDETVMAAPLRPASADPDFGLGLPGYAIGYRPADPPAPAAKPAVPAADTERWPRTEVDAETSVQIEQLIIIAAMAAQGQHRHLPRLQRPPLTHVDILREGLLHLAELGLIDIDTGRLDATVTAKAGIPATRMDSR